MRCPKCGYISYDRLERCSKCKSDLTAVSQKLHGTTLNVEAPAFLAMAFGAAAEAQMPAMAETDDASVYLDEDEISVSLDEEAAEGEEIAMLPIGLQDIDMSDLVPTPESEEPSMAPAESSTAGAGIEDTGMDEGIPFAGISAASLLAPEEGVSAPESAEEAMAVATAEEDVVDLSALMSGGQEQVGVDSGNDLTLDLTLANDSEEDVTGQEEMSFDFEAGLQEMTDLSLESEKENGEEEDNLPDHGLDLQLEMDDERV